jgi:hypothetical protein
VDHVARFCDNSAAAETPFLEEPATIVTAGRRPDRAAPPAAFAATSDSPPVADNCSIFTLSPTSRPTVELAEPQTIAVYRFDLASVSIVDRRRIHSTRQHDAAADHLIGSRALLES